MTHCSRWRMTDVQNLSQSVTVSKSYGGLWGGPLFLDRHIYEKIEL